MAPCSYSTMSHVIPCRFNSGVGYVCMFCFWSIFKELSDHSGIWCFCWTGTRLADVRATSFRHNIGGHSSIFQSFYGSTSRQGRILWRSAGRVQDDIWHVYRVSIAINHKILWMRFSLVGQVSVVILCPIYRPKYVSRETWNVFLSLVAHHKICGPIVCFFNSTDNFGHWIISEISCLFSNCNEQSRRLSFQVFRIGFHEIEKLYKVKVKIQYHSNIGVRLRRVTTCGPHTLVIFFGILMELDIFLVCHRYQHNLCVGKQQTQLH